MVSAITRSSFVDANFTARKEVSDASPTPCCEIDKSIYCILDWMVVANWIRCRND